MQKLNVSNEVIGRIKIEIDKCSFTYLSYAFSDNIFYVSYNEGNDVASELVVTKCVFAKYSIVLHPINTQNWQKGILKFKFKLVKLPTVFYDAIHDEYFNELDTNNRFLQSIIIHKENNFNIQLFYKTNYAFKNRVFDNVDMIELLRKRQLAVIDNIKKDEGEDVVFNQYRSYLVNLLRNSYQYNEIWGCIKLKYFSNTSKESFIEGLTHYKTEKFCQKSFTIFDFKQNVFDEEKFKFSLKERDFAKYRFWVEQLNRIEVDVTPEFNIIRFYGTSWMVSRKQKDNLLFGIYYKTNEGITSTYQRLGRLIERLYLFNGIFHLNSKYFYLAEPPDIYDLPNFIDDILRTIRVTEVGYSRVGKDNTFETYCYFDLDKLTFKRHSIEYISNFIRWLGNEYYHNETQKVNEVNIRVTICSSSAYSPSFGEIEINSESMKNEISSLFKKHFNVVEFFLFEKGTLMQ